MSWGWGWAAPRDRSSVRKGSGAYDAMIALAEQCMTDYDDDGWTGDTWFDPSDIGNMSDSSV